ncbi:MAG: hypothetical protein ACI87O_002952, partial [Planctomycetota bacterium]
CIPEDYQTTRRFTERDVQHLSHFFTAGDCGPTRPDIGPFVFVSRSRSSFKVAFAASSSAWFSLPTISISLGSYSIAPLKLCRSWTVKG